MTTRYQNPGPNPGPNPTRGRSWELEGGANHRRGYMFMLLATLGFSVMYVLERYSQARLGLSSARALLVRAVVQTALAAAAWPFLARSGSQILEMAPRGTRPLLCFRGVVGALTLALHMAAMRLVPAGEVAAILFTSPVFTMAAARVALGEPVSAVDVVAGLVSIGGGVLVVAPWTDGGDSDAHNATTGSSGSGVIGRRDRVVGSMFALGAAMLGAVTYTAVRKLGTSIHFLSSVLALGVCAMVLALALGGAFNPAALGAAERDAALLMALSGVFGFVGQCGINRGLQLCRAGRGILIRNIDVPVVYALTITFLGEAPSVVRGIGATLIVLSALAVAVAKL